MTRAAVTSIVVLVAGAATGAAAVALARAHPDFSLAGSSPFRDVAELAAGFALLAAGVVALQRRFEARSAVLLAAAAFPWFLVEWNNPGAGSAAVFTVGVVLGPFCGPLLAQAALSLVKGRAAIDRAVLGAGYTGAALLGVVPALFFDPAAQGCSQCPGNIVLLHGSAPLSDRLGRFGVLFGIGWAAAAAVLILFRLWRASPARRRLIGITAGASSLFLVLLATDFAHAARRGFLSNDLVDRRLWVAESVALAVAAGGVAGALALAGRLRAAVARLVVELAELPGPGMLRASLALLLHDDSLQIAYRLDDGTLVDDAGRAAELHGAVTPIVRDGAEVALIGHRAGLLDDPAVVEDVSATARLAFENERLRAEVRAQLERLRASRARIVETASAERRRLERDLHDGAQQRLVALSIGLALARAEAPQERLLEADRELKAALAELRRIANGLFPAALAEEGLPAALAALVEETDAPIVLGPLDEERVDPRVEAAAYFVVVTSARRVREGPIRVTTARSNGLFVLELEHECGLEGELGDLEDRVGALDGRIVPLDAGLRAEIPCAS